MEWTWAVGDRFKYFDPRGFYQPVKVIEVRDDLITVLLPHSAEMSGPGSYWLEWSKELEHASSSL
jgi:hypothetical protein